MTTWTSEDKEQAYKKILEEAPAHIGYEDAVDPVALNVESAEWVNASPPHIVNTGASYEPIPFAGLIALQDKEDTEQMLREQLHVVQAECQRLQAILRQAGIPY